MPAEPLRRGPRPPRLAVSFFPDVFDQRPIQRLLAWQHLADRLARFPLRDDTTDKRRLPCWAPTEFRRPDSATMATVSSVSCLVLDIDAGASISTALERCAGFTLLLHTSWSHRGAAPRFRVVLPLCRPVPADRWADAWTQAIHALALPIDRKCRNANRRYLLPALPHPRAEHHAECRDTDSALDLTPLEAAPPERRVRPRLRRVVVPHHRIDRAVRGRFRHEPAARRGLAEALGATLRGSGAGERAEGIVCPACGRPSAWFLVAPETATRARCNHRNSCGWTGPLEALWATAA